jgi:hypothetical protein
VRKKENSTTHTAYATSTPEASEASTAQTNIIESPTNTWSFIYLGLSNTGRALYWQTKPIVTKTQAKLTMYPIN